MQHSDNKEIEVVVEIVNGGVKSYPKRCHDQPSLKAVYVEQKISGITHYMSRVEFSSRRNNILT